MEVVDANKLTFGAEKASGMLEVQEGQRMEGCPRGVLEEGAKDLVEVSGKGGENYDKEKWTRRTALFNFLD